MYACPRAGPVNEVSSSVEERSSSGQVVMQDCPQRGFGGGGTRKIREENIVLESFGIQPLSPRSPHACPAYPSWHHSRFHMYVKEYQLNLRQSTFEYFEGSRFSERVTLRERGLCAEGIVSLLGQLIKIRLDIEWRRFIQ